MEEEFPILGMKKENKWKYLIYFQNEEFNELICKEILLKLSYRKEKIGNI